MPVEKANLDIVCAELEFCQLRAVKERRAAARAADDAAKEGHRALAERYADRASSLAEEHDLQMTSNDGEVVGRKARPYS